MVYLPRKTALILMLVLGIISLVDGIYKKDLKEILIISAILLYAIISLVNGPRKNLPGKNDREPFNNQTTNT